MPDASELRVTMWRKTDDRKVWYEWIVDVFISTSPPTPTPTLAGPKSKGNATATPSRPKKIRVGGSELHSSEKDACLM